jgi:hypothetical protein
MRDALDDQFVAGTALHADDQLLPFGHRLIATPSAALGEL